MLLPPPQNNVAPTFRAVPQDVSLYSPKTGSVVDAYVDEAFHGVGTLAADIQASDVENAKGNPLTAEEYQKSEFYRPGIQYYGAMTDAAAKTLAKYHDERAANAEIINRASTAQTALGIAAALTTGIAEPKNLAFGIGTGGALALGREAVMGARMIVNARRANSGYAAAARMGALDGLVSAAVMEPSNRYSAHTLQQDYTMADSLFNVATSGLLGAGLHVAPKFIKERFFNAEDKVKAYDTTLAEIDTATNQLAQGKRVDVGAVESATTGTKPQFVARPDPFATEVKARTVPADNYTKGLSEYSPIMYREAHPSSALEVMPGGNIATEVPELYLADNLDLATGQGRNKGGVMLAFDTTNLKGRINKDKPTWQIPYEQGMGEYVGRYNNQSDYQRALVGVRVPDGLQLSKTDSMMFNRTLAAMENSGWEKIKGEGFTEYRKPAEVRSETDATDTLRKAVQDDLDPDNDTAIDHNAADAVDSYESIELNADETAALDGYMKEIADMKRNGVLNEADEAAMNEAFASVKEEDIKRAWDALYICLTRG